MTQSPLTDEELSELDAPARAPNYAHPESDGAKATRAHDVAVRNALPRLLAELRSLRAEKAARGEVLEARWLGP